MKKTISILFILLILINILIIPSHAIEEKTGYVNITVDIHTYRPKEFNNENIIINLKNHQTNQIKTITLTNDYNYKKTEELPYGNYYIENIYSENNLIQLSKGKPFEINDINQKIDIGINFPINNELNQINPLNTLTLKLDNNEILIDENIIVKIKEKNSNEKYTFHLNEENNYTFANQIKNGIYIIDKDNSIINNKFKVFLEEEIKIENNNLTKYINIKNIQINLWSIIFIIIFILLFIIIPLYKTIKGYVSNYKNYINLSKKINNIYLNDKNKNLLFLKYFYYNNILNKNIFLQTEIEKFEEAKEMKNKKNQTEIINFYTYRLNYLKELETNQINFTAMLGIFTFLFAFINITKINEEISPIILLISASLILIACIQECHYSNIKLKNIKTYKYLEIEILEELLDIKEKTPKTNKIIIKKSNLKKYKQHKNK